MTTPPALLIGGRREDGEIFDTESIGLLRAPFLDSAEDGTFVVELLRQDLALGADGGALRPFKREEDE